MVPGTWNVWNVKNASLLVQRPEPPPTEPMASNATSRTCVPSSSWTATRGCASRRYDTASFPPRAAAPSITTSSRSAITSRHRPDAGSAGSASITRLFGAFRLVTTSSSPPANPAQDSDTPSATAVTNGVSRARSLTWISVGPDEPSTTCTTIQRPSSETTVTGI